MSAPQDNFAYECGVCQEFYIGTNAYGRHLNENEHHRKLAQAIVRQHLIRQQHELLRQVNQLKVANAQLATENENLRTQNSQLKRDNGLLEERVQTVEKQINKFLADKFTTLHNGNRNA